MGLDARVEFYQDNEGKYRWKLKAPNGEIICVPGEGFESRRNAAENYATVRKHLQSSPLIVDLQKES